MIKKLCFFLIFCVIFTLNGAIDYTVSFTGVHNPELRSKLEEASLLNTLNDFPPKTLSALKKRAEDDIDNLVKALHSQARYNAKIDFRIKTSTDPVLVEFLIDKGPVYPINETFILPKDLNISGKEIGLIKGIPAEPKTLIEAEEQLIELLIKQGYPYAAVVDKDFIADQETKSISTTFHVETGPLSTFGQLTIKGNKEVSSKYIIDRIFWKKGERFDPKKVHCTANAIDAGGLFTAVNISYPEFPPKDGALPITIELEEAKHRTIALGLSYSTQRGPGFTLEWENRNHKKVGERLSFDANVLSQVQQAKIQHILPSFLAPNQSLIWALEFEHDITESFVETWGSISATIENEINDCARASYGALFKHVIVSGSDNNGPYSLLKTPAQFRWSNTNDYLDPETGSTFFSQITPTMQISNDSQFYTISNFSYSAYAPFFDNRLVLAGRVQLGSIIGAARKKISPSERFYAGSETALRGYKYFTVSPINKTTNNPTGGRSMLIYSLEARWKMTDSWGGVLFFDMGNVYKNVLPKLSYGMYKSIGAGARYYTPVGPIRFDVAFPLNRRKKIDPPFQFYFSIGQSF